MNVLVLRKCFEDGASYNGKFQYPDSGLVEAPDWNGKPECGGGLHGLLWGGGGFDVSTYGTYWLIIEVDDSPDNLVVFNGKCKFHKGNVLLKTSDQAEAIVLLKSHPNYPKDNVLNYDIDISNTSKTIVSGDGSTLEAGNDSTLKAGDDSTLKAGYGSTLKAGDGSTLEAGYGSTLEAGYGSTLKAGYGSTLKAGYGSTLKAGYGSTLKAGYGSTLEAGYGSVLIVYWYDGDGKYQVKTKIIKEVDDNKTFKFKSGKWKVVK